jgi:hypothetical protein
MSYRTNINGVVGPEVTMNLDALEQKVATFAATRSPPIADNAAWAAFIATRFDNTNASGLTAGTRTLLSEFFANLVTFTP